MQVCNLSLNNDADEFQLVCPVIEKKFVSERVRVMLIVVVIVGTARFEHARARDANVAFELLCIMLPTHVACFKYHGCNTRANV